MTELPPLIRDASAWIGPDLVNQADWIELLSAAELVEIKAASRRLAAAEIDWFEPAKAALDTRQFAKLASA